MSGAALGGAAGKLFRFSSESFVNLPHVLKHTKADENFLLEEERGVGGPAGVGPGNADYKAACLPA